MSLNVSSLYFTSVAFAPLLHAAYNADPSSEAEPKESPCIINIGSIAGFHNAVSSSSAASHRAELTPFAWNSAMLLLSLTKYPSRLLCTSLPAWLLASCP